MDFIVDRKRQQPFNFASPPKLGLSLTIFSFVFLFIIFIDYLLPAERVEGVVEQTITYQTQRTSDTFISIDNENMMLSGIPVSEDDFIAIKRSPIFHQILSYEIGNELDDGYDKGTYYGHYYGVFCFIPISLLIATISLCFNLKTNDFLKPLSATILFLTINIWMALA